MRLLLDTHAFLWAAAESEKLSKQSRAAIEDAANEVYVSAVSAWEITIKCMLRKLTLPLAPAAYVPARMNILGFGELAVQQEHAFALSALPPHHMDPFDRMLVAQAQVEGLTLVTADPNLLKYPCKLLDARR